MTWIKTIPYVLSTGKLKKLYARLGAPERQIDQILLTHSLRPHTLAGHMALYKSVLHHAQNKLPKWYLESLGVYVSHLNHCSYCVDHHLAGLQRLVDESTFASIKRSLFGKLSDYFDSLHQLGFLYAHELTVHPGKMEEESIAQLRLAGFSDGEILEINQVTAYFNYANRVVLGLGISTSGEKLGQSPRGSDENDWHHN